MKLPFKMESKSTFSQKQTLTEGNFKGCVSQAPGSPQHVNAGDTHVHVGKGRSSNIAPKVKNMHGLELCHHRHDLLSQLKMEIQQHLVMFHLFQLIQPTNQ